MEFNLPQNKKIVLLSLFSKPTHETKKFSPKSYSTDYSKHLVKLLYDKNIYTVQIAISEEPSLGADIRFDNLSFPDLKILCSKIDSFVCCDNFFQHFIHYYDPQKIGIVIFSQSDPKLFGYNSNVNLLKDPKYLRPGKEQYQFWEGVNYEKSAFTTPEIVLENMCNLLGVKD